MTGRAARPMFDLLRDHHQWVRIRTRVQNALRPWRSITHPGEAEVGGLQLGRRLCKPLLPSHTSQRRDELLLKIGENEHTPEVCGSNPMLASSGQSARGTVLAPDKLLPVKALVLDRLSGPDALSIQDVPEPTVSPGQILVRVAAGGLNFADVMTTTGGYPGTPPPPMVVGREFSGVEEGTRRRVMGYAQWAAFAERIAAHSNLLWPVPEHWTDEQAAAFPVNYFTAYLAYWQAGITPTSGSNAATNNPMRGQPLPAVQWSEGPRRVLIHAVAGGVGTAAVQIGRLLGVEMYGTSSTDEKLARVKELGLHRGINYRQRDYEGAIKDLTHGEGVDAVFEMLGGEHTAKSLRCLRDFGRVIQYGTATGKPPQLDVRAMYAKSGSLQGLWLTYLSQKRDIMEPAWTQLSSWIAQRKLVPVIGQVLPLERAQQAYKLLQEGRNYGKVVVKIA